MAVLTERRRTGKVGLWPYVLGSALLLTGALLAVPLVHQVDLEVWSPWSVHAYSLASGESPWPWTPDPKPGFGRQHRMIGTGYGHQAYTFRLGPLVYEIHSNYDGP